MPTMATPAPAPAQPPVQYVQYVQPQVQYVQIPPQPAVQYVQQPVQPPPLPPQSALPPATTGGGPPDPMTAQQCCCMSDAQYAAQQVQAPVQQVQPPAQYCAPIVITDPKDIHTPADFSNWYSHLDPTQKANADRFFAALGAQEKAKQEFITKYNAMSPEDKAAADRWFAAVAAQQKQASLTAQNPVQQTPVQTGDVRSRLVAIAAAEVGVHEEGKNAGERIVEYRTSVTAVGEDANLSEPWCSDFASWVFRQAGIPIGINGQGQDYVPYLMDWAQKSGRWFDRASREPQPGDLIVFNWDGNEVDHVGVVDHVENGRVFTIEGNSDDAVSRKDYALDSGEVAGYISAT